MADIPSPVSYTKLNDVEIDNEKPVTTALFYKFGENTNKLIDDIGTAQDDIDTINTCTQLTPGTISWSYDSTSNKTYMIYGSITKTKATPVQLSLPLNYRDTALTITTTGTSTQQEPHGFLTYRNLTASFSPVTFFMFRSAQDVSTPNGCTNITFLFGTYGWLSSWNIDPTTQLGHYLATDTPTAGSTTPRTYMGTLENAAIDYFYTSSGVFSYGVCFLADGDFTATGYADMEVLDNKGFIREL